MRQQLETYLNKLVADRSAQPLCSALAAQDDRIVSFGNRELSSLAGEILQQLNALALCIATPSLPFAGFLLQRAEGQAMIIPRDTETRTFLHDIPLIRTSELGSRPADLIAHHLGSRKGVIVEGIGIIAVGALTVEQAYINWSSVFHATFIKYLEDVLAEGIVLPDEVIALDEFRNNWLQTPSAAGLTFRSGTLTKRDEILDEISTVGRYTVQQGLVDSFFGNISYRADDLIYISQTASSLDQLNGCIDPVPFDNRSTVGITASSELAAHRGIYDQTGCRAILHGHPRFAVIMSMLCSEQTSCQVTDCWRACPKERALNGTAVVAGEIGAGGLARNVPPAMSRSGGRAIVYGHGVFTSGKENFQEAFSAMIEVETWCRQEYFRLFDERWGAAQ